MANYWDSLKTAIANTIGKSIAAPVQAALGLGTGLAEKQAATITPVAAPVIQAQGEQLQKQVGSMGKTAATAAVGAITKPAEFLNVDTAFNLGMEQLNKAYEFAYPKVAQPISAALLTNADLVAGDGLNIVKNWTLGRQVSPGQAAANLLGTELETAGVTPLLEKKGLSLPTFLSPNFNIADPDERKKAFQDEVFGKVLSGSLDGFLNWYADPLVIAGKGAKALRLAGLNRPIRSAEDVVRLRSELDSHGMWLKTDGQIGRETPMGVIAQRLVGKTPEQAIDDVFVKNTTNPRFVASIAGELDNYDDVADFIAAAAGDKNSLLKLEKTKASIADEIQRTQNILEPIQKRYNSIDFGQAINFNQHMPTIEEYDKLTNVLNDLTRRDRNLAEALNQKVSDYRVIRDYTSAADVEVFNKNIGVAVEKARTVASEVYHNVSFFTEKFQKTPFSRAVTVITLPFTKLPRGIVRVDGGPVADSYNEIKYALNSVKPLRGIEYAAVKNELARSYINARNAQERMVAVQNIEQELADIIALEKGFTPEDARLIYNEFGKVRRGLMDSMQTKGFWVDDAGDLVSSPFWKSEMPNIVPMMNFKDFSNFLDIYRVSKRPGATALKIAKEGEDWLDFANSFFKASVLTRMGYPIRNTIDGQMRAALTLGSLAKTDNVIKNFSKNTVTRLQIAKDYGQQLVQLKTPGMLRTGTGKAISMRNSYIDVRNQILDELTPEKYYAGASGVFGKPIEPGMVELAISSKTAPILDAGKRLDYFKLKELKDKQNGLLFGKDKKKFERLQQEAFGKYVKQEVVGKLPENTTLVYADFPSGKIFYKVPGEKGRLPKGAFPGIEPRKGLPAGLLEGEMPKGMGIKARAKHPGAQPDIRVVTSYDLSRSKNFEDIAEILGEDQMNRIRIYTQNIEALNNQIDNLIEESQKIALIRSELKIVKGGEKDVKIITPKGVEVSAGGAFAGPNGMAIRDEAASDKTLNWLTESQAYMTFDAQKGLTSHSFTGKLGPGRVVVNPTDPQYFNELAVFANRFLRNDQLAMRLLAGQSDKQILEWFRKDGQFYLNEIKAYITKEEVVNHIAEARARLNRVFPDRQIQSLISREELTPEQFDVLMRGVPNLSPIAGRKIMEDTFRYGSSTTRNVVNQTLSKLFKVIGSTPENNLVAWPFYEKLYKRALTEEVKIAEGLGKNLQDPDLIIQLQRTAHSQALKTTNEVLYRVTNNTGMSNTLRFLIPFFNAQYNAVKVYGKFMFEDPSRIARTQQLWNAPNRVATVVDNEGNQVPPGKSPATPQFLLFTIPEGLQGKFGIPKGYGISIPKNSLNVFITGENPLAPSFGLPVQIPLSSFANNRPEVVEDVKAYLTRSVGASAANAIISSLLPFGKPAEKPWDLLLPAAARKYAASQAGLDNVAFASAVASAMKTQRNEWIQGGRVGKEPTFDSAIKLAKHLYDIRIAVNMTLPFTFSFRPEWQVIIDDYRRAISDPLVGPNKINDYILGKWGDLGYILTAPTTKNVTGVVPTGNAVKNAKEFKNLIAKMDTERLNAPGLVGFIVNNGIETSKYSDAASNYFKDRVIRTGGDVKYTERRTTEDVLKDREVSLGWYYYQKLSAQMDKMLADNGLKSVNSSAAEQLGLKAQWDNKIKELEKYLPAWRDDKEFGNADINRTKRYIKGLITIVSDKDYMNKYGNTPTMRAVSDYVAARTYVANELVNRKEYYGDGSITSIYNTDLKEKWDDYIFRMKNSDKGFSDLYTRYLENDKFGVIK